MSVVMVPEPGTPGEFLDDDDVRYRVVAWPVRGWAWSPFTFFFLRQYLPSLTDIEDLRRPDILTMYDAYHNFILKSVEGLKKLEVLVETPEEEEILQAAARGTIFNRLVYANLAETLVSERSVTDMTDDDWMVMNLMAGIWRDNAHEFIKHYPYPFDVVGIKHINQFCELVADNLVECIGEETGKDLLYESLSVIEVIDPRVDCLHMAIPDGTKHLPIALPEEGWYNSNLKPDIGDQI